MTSSDVAGALQLWHACDGVGLSEGDTADGVAAFLERNPAMSCVAIDDGRVIGTVLAGHDGRRGFLYHLAVDSSFRRRGVARALVQSALASLRSAGVLKCHALVFRTNREGAAFWAHMGWLQREDIDVYSLTAEPRS